MTIYIDQMFFENFIMNYIILYATSKFSGKQERWYRLCIGALIGALYVIASYVFLFYNKPFIVIKILLAIVMVFSSFTIKCMKEFIKLFVIFVAITFFIGGVSIGLAFFANVSMIKEGGVLYVSEFPIFIIGVGVIVSYIIGKWLFILLKNRINLRNFLYDIEIKLFDKTLCTTAFLDSGHNAKEIFTGYPIIIVEKEKFGEIVPKQVEKSVSENNFEFDEKWKRRLRILPFSTINIQKDILIGFKVDECIIHMDIEDKHISNLIVASCDRKLDSEDRYFALMGNILDS